MEQPRATSQVPHPSVVKSQRDVPGDVIVTQKSRVFKVIVIGDSNVGKTCLTFRFCGGRFPDRVETTIGVDFREKTVTVSGEEIKLQIWDTAGQERFRRSMVSHYYRNVHAIVFVYDVTKMATFENLPNWISECNHNSVDQSTLRILVGNKSDMGESNKTVSSTMARKFAECNDMSFYETSAKDETETVYISDIFVNIAQRLHAIKSGAWWTQPVDRPAIMPPPNNVMLRPELSDRYNSFCGC